MREEGQAYRKPYGGRRGNGHHRGGYRGNDGPVSNQDAQDNEPREADNNANEGGPRFRKKFIRRDNEDGGRFNRRGGEHRGRGGDRRGGKIENRDLDRQLRDYWITTKGGERATEGDKDLAREKLNSEMDSYWKNKKQEEKKAE